MSMPIGTCKLCLTPAVELRDSHYIPAAVFRQLRDSEARSPHPYVITDRASVQTSKQQKAHLLCNACEGRLSANGEDWVLKHFLKADGTFKLEDILRSRTPFAAVEGNPNRFYLAGEIPQIDTAALSYFAASIFWRGSIYPWNTDSTVPIPLGKYAEPFRRYLMGEQAFPADSALFLAVREGDAVSMLTASPYGGRVDGIWTYRFAMPGLVFILNVGRQLTAKMHQYCFAKGERNPMVWTSALEEYLQEQAVNVVQAQAKAGRPAARPKR